jgi:hypothetical protein
MLCLGTAFNAMNGALALFAGQATPSEIRLLMVLSNAADNFQFLPLGVFIGAASLGMVRGRVFARWIGWLGVVGSVCLIAGSMDVTNVGDGIGDLGMVGLLVFLIWIIALSVTLLRHPVVVNQAREMPAKTDRVAV